MKLKILVLSILLYSYSGFAQFITEWNTTASSSITVPTTGGGYNYTATIALLSSPNTIITTLNNVTGNANFTNLTPNTDYQIKITGNFPRIYINNGSERFKLKKVTQWGNIAWTSFAKAFFNCPNLNITATDIPNLSNVTDMAQMFQYCAALNGPANIGNWNTANVTNMWAMFTGATIFNQNIGTWNTAAVTDMGSMFGATNAFNQNIGNWNTSAVTNMSSMFYGATAFNQNLGNWNTASVTNMSYMFQDATSFNGTIGSWNTANVTDMRNMFQSTPFNQPIGSWDTGAVTNMDSMFRYAEDFNQPIGDWDVSSVTNLGVMFNGAYSFNQDIGEWDTSNVVATAHMFNQATAFNQDISGWDVSAVFNMQFMFQDAASFNQDISGWDISAVLYLDAMFKGAVSFDQNMAGWADDLNPAVLMNSSFGGVFDNCGMSVANYDATLVGFSEQGPAGLSMGAAGLYYCNEGAEARANLTLPLASGGKGWTISGDTSLAASVPILAPSTSNISLIATECNYNWANPANKARKMLIIDENGNSVSPSSVVLNNNSIGPLPTGVTSANNYYQKSSGTNSVRVGHRMASITDDATYTENEGIIVRVYYSTTEYTNIVTTPPPAGEIIDAGWFLSVDPTPWGIVGTMSNETYALPGAVKIIPFNSGFENGYAFVEFKLTKPGTVGLYAKTQDGPLSEVLSTSEINATIEVSLYPNPAKAVLNIALPEGQDFEVKNIAITSLLGQTVYNSSGNTAIDVSSLSSGIYLIAVATDKGNWTGKFVKE